MGQGASRGGPAGPGVHALAELAKEYTDEHRRGYAGPPLRGEPVTLERAGALLAGLAEGPEAKGLASKKDAALVATAVFWDTRLGGRAPVFSLEDFKLQVQQVPAAVHGVAKAGLDPEFLLERIKLSMEGGGSSVAQLFETVSAFEHDALTYGELAQIVMALTMNAMQKPELWSFLVCVYFLDPGATGAVNKQAVLDRLGQVIMAPREERPGDVSADILRQQDGLKGIEGAPSYSLARIPEFLRASAKRQQASEGSGTVRGEQENVLGHVDNLMTLAKHHVRVEEFVKTLGVQIADIEGSQELWREEFKEGMGRIRRQLETIEGALSSQLHITAWNHLQGLKVQYSKYQKVKRDIIQVVKLAEDTLLESDPRAFLKKSEAFKAQAGELLKILGLDLKPCVPKDFDYSLQVDDILAALGEIVTFGDVAKTAAAHSSNEMALEQDLREAWRATNELQVKLAIKEEELKKLQSVKETTSEVLEKKITDLELRLLDQRAQHEEALAEAKEEALKEVRAEFREQQEEFERRLSKALEQSEAALLRESGKKHQFTRKARPASARPAAGLASPEATTSPYLARARKGHGSLPSSPAEAAAGGLGLGPKTAELKRSLKPPTGGTIYRPQSAAKKREVRRGLGFGASSNRFSVDGSLMRLNEGRGGKSG